MTAFLQANSKVPDAEIDISGEEDDDVIFLAFSIGDVGDWYTENPVDVEELWRLVRIARADFYRLRGETLPGS